MGYRGAMWLGVERHFLEGRDVSLAFAEPAEVVYNYYRTVSITLYVGHRVYLPIILKNYP